MRTVSWVLLSIVGGLTLLASLVSSGLAYSRNDYPIAGVSVTSVAAGRPAVETGLRAARGTAAAYAGGFATLFLAVVLGPYRRGDVASWWTLLLGTLVMAGLVFVRVPLLATKAGTGAAAIQLGVVLVALLLDVGRVRGR